jgi:hypothetical protein
MQEVSKVIRKHELKFFKVSEGTDAGLYLVTCLCGFREVDESSNEIQDLATKHRDKYILNK